jgi:hypothetical protein
MSRVITLPQIRSGVRLSLLVPLLVVGLLILTMLIFAAPSLSKPLIMDEMEFRAAAKAIVETGKPISYVGENKPQNVGLWHPPLYIVSLAGWMSFVGTSSAANRSFGLLTTFLALIGIGVLAARRWNWKGSAETANLPKFVALFLGLSTAITAPLLIQGSMLPDIDTQMLPLTITAFFLLLFELRRIGVQKRVYWSIFILAMIINLFTKLTTPALLIPAFALFELLQPSATRKLFFKMQVSRPRLDQRTHPDPRYRVLISWNTAWFRWLAFILPPIIAGLVSLALFVLIWYVIAFVWGVNFRAPFNYLTHSRNNPTTFADTPFLIIAAIIQNLPSHLTYLLQWTGVPILAFVALMIGREFFGPSDGILARAERAAIYMFCALLIGMYLILRPAPFVFPKYHPPLVLPFSLLVIDFLFAHHKDRSFWPTIGLLSIEVIAYLTYIIFTQPRTQWDFIYNIYYEWPKLPFFWRWMFGPLLILIIINGVLWLISKRRIGAPLLIAALAVTLGWQTSEALIQTRVTYATTYYYGEESLFQARDYLRSVMPDQAIIIAPKDLGDLLVDRWRYIELAEDPRPDLDRPNVQFLAVRSNDYYGHTFQDTPAIAKALADKFDTITTIKNFTIMKRKS